MVEEVCRFWDSDPPLFRRLVGLAAVDAEVGQVRESRECWRYRQMAAVVRRLASDGALEAEFTTDQAVAVTFALTAFPACDQMAASLGIGFTDLPSILLPALRGRTGGTGRRGLSCRRLAL